VVTIQKGQIGIPCYQNGMRHATPWSKEIEKKKEGGNHMFQHSEFFRNSKHLSREESGMSDSTAYSAT
jgi:hypothetical protein